MNIVYHIQPINNSKPGTKIVDAHLFFHFQKILINLTIIIDYVNISIYLMFIKWGILDHR